MDVIYGLSGCRVSVEERSTAITKKEPVYTRPLKKEYMEVLFLLILFDGIATGIGEMAF